MEEQIYKVTVYTNYSERSLHILFVKAFTKSGALGYATEFCENENKKLGFEYYDKVHYANIVLLETIN